MTAIKKSILRNCAKVTASHSSTGDAWEEWTSMVLKRKIKVTSSRLHWEIVRVEVHDFVLDTWLFSNNLDFISKQTF